VNHLILFALVIFGLLVSYCVPATSSNITSASTDTEAMINELIKTGKFTEEEAKEFVSLTMQNGTDGGPENDTINNDVNLPKPEKDTINNDVNLPKPTMKEGIELSGPVTYVVDGDTLDVNDVRVRLALVDTPEVGEKGYQSAKDFVKNLCLGNGAEVDIDDGQRGGDRYGREVGVVYCNGVNVNSELLKKGHAITYTDYCDVSEFANDGWSRCNTTTDNESDSEASNAITEKKQGNCDPSYPDVCIPSPPPDLDCSDVSEKNFKVKGSDPHRFDNDNDGNACES
jgi:micrococcal nuclease